MRNRFSLPWSVEEQDGRFIVRDNNGRALNTVYFEDQPKRHSFTRDEARHLARNLSELPQLLRQGEGGNRALAVNS
jgi:hypothetical protein